MYKISLGEDRDGSGCGGKGGSVVAKRIVKLKCLLGRFVYSGLYYCK